MELVRWQNENGQGIWFMSYCGGMLPELRGDERLAYQTFEFLKKMLLKVNPEKPFRGPSAGVEGDLTYINNVHGNIERFNGEEYIDLKDFDRNDAIFSQNYHGGLIIP